MAGKGSAPGERRGGRKKGVPNKATRDIKALAQKHGPEAIRGIVKLAKFADNEATRLAAYNALLDRGYGKARQIVGGDDDGPAIQHIHRVIIGSEDTNR